MIQAAHVAPAPSRCHAVCFLPPLRCGPVESCPVGGGLRPKDRARKAAGIEPAVAVEAALRCATSVHVGARRVSSRRKGSGLNNCD